MGWDHNKWILYESFHTVEGKEKVGDLYETVSALLHVSGGSGTVLRDSHLDMKRSEKRREEK